MKLVVGLGNPGPKYDKTRHNVGFQVAERFAFRHQIAVDERRFSGLYGEGRLGDQQVGVLQPQTFMNRSGEAVAAALAELSVDEPERDLIVVYDEMDLPRGRIRLRHGGGPGGHNGIGDVIDALGTSAVPRLRFGVGRPPDGTNPIDWVLSRFTPEEERELLGVIDFAACAMEFFVGQGMDAAMNRFNLQHTDLEDSADS